MQKMTPIRKKWTLVVIVCAAMDVWSLNHFHTQAPTLHEAYCTLHAAYSSSPESILKWTKEISPLEGVEVGGGWCTPPLGWAQLGGGWCTPPPWMGTAGGGRWCTPPWNGNSWGGVVHLPWSEGKLGVVDIQAFEVGDGALCRKKILARLEGGVVQPPLAWAGLEQGWGGAPPPSLNESERQMENSQCRTRP